MPHTDLNSLTPGQDFAGVYCLVNPQQRKTRADKPFLQCSLRDATASLEAKQWDLNPGDFPALEQAKFVQVKGRTEEYRGQVQIVLNKVQPTTVTEEQLAYLLPMTQFDIEEMFSEVKDLLDTLEHPAVRALADTYLADDELMQRFRRAPAAMNVHHAWIGGLLEHTLQLMRVADHVMPLYPHLNRDLVMIGLFLHDLGKTTELSWDGSFDYTTDGLLIGHIVRGAIWLEEKARISAERSGHPLPKDALIALQHIILSHHGEPEFGAAKKPASPEAIMVAQIDNLDAKSMIALGSINREDDSRPDFTQKVWALDTKLYQKDPLRKTEAASSDQTTTPDTPPEEQRSDQPELPF